MSALQSAMFLVQRAVNFALVVRCDGDSVKCDGVVC